MPVVERHLVEPGLAKRRTTLLAREIDQPLLELEARGRGGRVGAGVSAPGAETHAVARSMRSAATAVPSTATVPASEAARAATP